jgi:hypothetical protein
MLKNVWADKRKRIALIAVICVVVLVAAGTGGWLAWTKHELNTAKASCAQAADSLRVKANEYDALVNGDAATASAITVEQVKDAKTVETLAAALKEETPAYTGCVADSKTGLDTASTKLEEQANWYTTHQASLTKAVKNVNQSKLDKIIDTANDLLNDSDGKVQDNATRDELSKAIEAKDEQRITEATQKVNDSIAAKTKADEEAKAQEEANNSNTSTQTTYTSGGNNYSYTSGGNTGSGSSSGGGSTSSAPQTSTQSNSSNQSTSQSENEWVSACGTTLGNGMSESCTGWSDGSMWR